MKILAWITLALVLLVVVALVYYLTIGAILFRIVFSRKSLSVRVLRKDIEQNIKDYKINLCWWEKIKFKKMQINSFDGLKLVGHWFDCGSNKTAIIVHGFGQDYREMQPYCKLFHDKNFNILAVSNRGHGESEGNIGFGWLDRKDLISWIEFLNKKNPEQEILLFGLSMGGTAVCALSGEKLAENVKAIVSDCAFANADRQISHIMKNHKLILKLFKKHLYSFSKRVHDFDIEKIDVAKTVKNCKLPMLFIHGQDDNFVPIENLSELYQSAQNRDKFVVEGAKHAMSYATSGVGYEKKISDFLKSRTNF